MQVKLNCKKKPVDFSSADFRASIRSRYTGKKTVDADFIVADDGSLLLDTGKQTFYISPDNAKDLSFFVDGDRTYIEAVMDNKGKDISFLFAPVEDNLTLWQDGVVNLRMSLEPLAQAMGIEVNEIIDPNPIGLCPDGIDNMDALIEERLIEGADILYMGQDEAPVQESAYSDFTDAPVPASNPYSDDVSGVYGDMDEFGDWEDILDEIEDSLDDDDEIAGQQSDSDYDFLYDEEAYVEPDPLPDDGYYGSDNAVVYDDADDIPIDFAIDDDFSSDIYDDIYDDDDEDDVEQDAWTPSAADFDVPAVASSADNFAVAAATPSVDNFAVPAASSSVDEIKINAAGAMDDAYSALTGLRASLEEERARRVNEMHRLAAELSGNDFIPVAETPAPAPVAAPAPVVIESEDPAEVAAALRAELEHLNGEAEDVSLELNDYDRIIAESRRQTQELVDSLDAGGDRDAVVAGLINMYQEQTERTCDINTMLKKEQVLKNNAIEQRDEAYRTIAEQKNELDKLRRSLKFSEKSKRKSEQFVKDAKREIHTTVQKARSKVEEAIAACERMQFQVEEAQARATSADERRSAAELARIEAYRVRDEALQELAEEKKNSQALLEACDRQLNEFINESVNKIQVQIERANTAEKNASVAAARVNELENELAVTRAQLQGFESKCSKKEVDIEQLRKQRDQAESRVSDMTVQYQSADTQRKETGRILSETEAELVRTRATVKKLSETLVAAKEAKDAAIAEKNASIQQMTEQCGQQAAAIAAEKDAVISSLTGAKEEALAANQQFIAAMSTALSLPDGFGARKKKLDAITDAYNSLVLSTQSAEKLGEVAAPSIAYAGGEQMVNGIDISFGMGVESPVMSQAQAIEPDPYAPVYGVASAPEPSPSPYGDDFGGLYVPDGSDFQARQ